MAEERTVPLDNVVLMGFLAVSTCGHGVRSLVLVLFGVVGQLSFEMIIPLEVGEHPEEM